MDEDEMPKGEPEQISQPIELDPNLPEGYVPTQNKSTETELDVISDQALNKVPVEGFTDEMNFNAARQTYGDAKVKEAVEYSLEKELAKNDAEFSSIRNPTKGDLEFFNEQAEEIKQKHKSALGKLKQPLPAAVTEEPGISVQMPGEVQKPQTTEIKPAAPIEEDMTAFVEVTRPELGFEELPTDVLDNMDSKTMAVQGKRLEGLNKNLGKLKELFDCIWS
jgi:hypothetical protein